MVAAGLPAAISPGLPHCFGCVTGRRDLPLDGYQAFPNGRQAHTSVDQTGDVVNLQPKEIEMLSSRYGGPNVRKARAARARVLGRMVRRAYVALSAWRRRQEDTLRKAAALDELSQRSRRMLGDIGLAHGEVARLRH